MPKKGKKSGAADEPDRPEWWESGPHPRGGRSGPLLDEDGEESGIARLYQEDEEEDPFTRYPEAAADVVRRRPRQPVDVNLAGLYRDADERPSLLDDEAIDDVLGGLFSEEEMDIEDVVGDDNGDDDNEGDDEEDATAEVGAAAQIPDDAVESEEVVASTSYTIVRREATLSLRDAGVQTSRGVSSLQKTINNKGKKNKRRRAKKRKAKPEESVAEAEAPAVAATPAVIEPAPSTSMPPAKRLKPAQIDARSRLNL